MTLINSIERDIDKFYKPLVNSFGGTDIFLRTALDKYQKQTDKFLYDILSHPHSLKILTAPSFSFYLDDFIGSTINTIILEKPYSVYSPKGDLLYRVSNHNGIFGNSILDRTLILQSDILDYYYLQYDTYQESKTILLIRGLLNGGIERKIKTGNENSRQLERELLQTNNYLNINPGNILRYSSFTNEIALGIDIYYQPSLPDYRPTVEDIINNSTPQQFNVNVSSSFQLNIPASGYIVFTQKSLESELIYLQPTITKGQGVHRFIEYADNIYYAALASEMNLDIVKQSFDLLQDDVPAFENSYQAVQLEVELNIPQL